MIRFHGSTMDGGDLLQMAKSYPMPESNVADLDDLPLTWCGKIMNYENPSN